MSQNEERTRGTPTHQTLGSVNRACREIRNIRREGPVDNNWTKTPQGRDRRGGKEGKGGKCRETNNTTNKPTQNTGQHREQHKEGTREPKTTQKRGKATKPKTAQQRNIFFSSGLADVAQRLGPNRKISSCKIKHNTRHCGHVHSSKSTLKQQPKNPTQPQTTRKSPGQIYISSKRKQTRQSNKRKRGMSPTKTPTTNMEILPPQWEGKKPLW